MYDDNFCFEKINPHCTGNYLLLTGLRSSHLWLLNGKNNGFTTNDWQEKHVFVYLVDFVEYLPGTNFVRGVFEDCPVSDKICKNRDKLSGDDSEKCVWTALCG